MSATAFDEFVRQEQEKTKGLDIQQEKSEWLKHLEELYRLIELYLQSWISSGQISLAYKPLLINEEYLGDYTVSQMLIEIGSKVIRLDPIGTFLIGSKGRVDVVGPFARAHLSLMDRKYKSISDMVRVSVSMNGETPMPPASDGPKEWIWRIFPRPPRTDLTEFSKDAFLQMLIEIANG